MATSAAPAVPAAAPAAGATGASRADERTLLEIVQSKYNELKQHRTSRLIFSAQLHATASPVDFSEFILQFLEGQSKRPELKV